VEPENEQIQYVNSSLQMYLCCHREMLNQWSSIFEGVRVVLIFNMKWHSRSANRTLQILLNNHTTIGIQLHNTFNIILPVIISNWYKSVTRVLNPVCML